MTKTPPDIHVPRTVQRMLRTLGDMGVRPLVNSIVMWRNRPLGAKEHEPSDPNVTYAASARQAAVMFWACAVLFVFAIVFGLLVGPWWIAAPAAGLCLYGAYRFNIVPRATRIRRRVKGRADPVEDAWLYHPSQQPPASAPPADTETSTDSGSGDADAQPQRRSSPEE
jgi:hypothetical protein